LIASLSNPETWVAILTLATLEIVLGVDNIVFLAIMTGRLPRQQRMLAYRLGLAGALLTRLLLLSTLFWLSKLESPLFALFGHPFSGHDLVLLAGGGFLLVKSGQEVFESVEGEPADHDSDAAPARGHARLLPTILQVMVIDMVFSLDSVITAVGLAKELWIMATAVIVAVAAMLTFAHHVGEFVNRHPSMKVLALSFLVLVGVFLIFEGFGFAIDKNYVYVAMGFSFFVEVLNLRMRGNHAKAKKATVPEIRENIE
jgi:predicted tellurium resistance membrane protein TerC